jgi:very-short-patch-repair endonuclease
MLSRGLVLGQKTRKLKIEQARALRRHMTAAERLLWQRLRANAVRGFHFRRQHIIHGFIVDFYCHAARLVIEIDGRIHYNTRDYDRSRETVLSGRGLAIHRFTNVAVEHDIDSVVAWIEAAPVTATSSPDHPLPSQGRGSGG